MTAIRKPKGVSEFQMKYGIEGGKHLGPVYALNRIHQLNKYFLSVGDWSAKV